MGSKMSKLHRRGGTTVAAIAVGSAVLAACSSAAGSATSKDVGADGWSKAYSGTQLNVIGEATANTQIIQNLLPDFEAKTGIHVNIEQAPYDSLVQKAVLDFTTKKGNYDVLSIPYEYLGSFAEKRYIAPIDDFVNKPPAGLGTTFS